MLSNITNYTHKRATTVKYLENATKILINSFYYLLQNVMFKTMQNSHLFELKISPIAHINHFTLMFCLFSCISVALTVYFRPKITAWIALTLFSV